MASHIGLCRQVGLSGVSPINNLPERGFRSGWRVAGTGLRIPLKSLTLSSQVLVPTSTCRASAGGTSGKDNNEGCFSDAMALIAGAEVLPKLVVVDLDYTIWPLFCQYQTSPLPDTPSVYPEAVDIIRALAASRIALAVASRTPALAIAMHFMEKLSIAEYFSYLEIYYTALAKTKHLNSLKEKSGVPFGSMLFFEDETKNVEAARKMGVSTVMVDEGLNLKALKEGLSLLAPSSLGTHGEL